MAVENQPDPSRARVVLLAFGDREGIADRVRALRPLIDAHVDVVAEDSDFEADLSVVEADATLVFGGDGSILRAARQMGDRQLPVVGVNFGKLGFLAHYQPGEVETVLRALNQHAFRVVEHLMFRTSVLREGRVIFERLGLNETTVLAGPPFHILDVELYVDSELATTYSCDGLIVSTPVGSTAHSLSAGGPILRKDLQAFVISPISPHTLTNRPVIDNASRIYELVAPRPNEGTSLVVDGEVVCQLTAADRVRIERAPACFQLVEAAGHGYYRTLREKLGWGGRLRSLEP
ncbi:MAG: NAD(+)/NADH kinase [Planctomycetales bacterium]|nr:NAD(+)/NADH kinase [Planctomycetales bacterium]